MINIAVIREQYHTLAMHSSLLLALRRALPALFFLAVVVVYFWPFLFLGETFIPADILSGMYPWKGTMNATPAYNDLLQDVIFSYFPRSYYYSSMLHQGKLALWDPYTFSGHPLLANGWSGQLYPISMLFNLLTAPEVAHDLGILLHLFGMGCFMYLFLGEWRVGQFGRLVGGVAWMLNGVAAVWLEFAHTVTLGALLALGLLFAERAVRRRSLPYGILTGTVIGLLLLAGHIQRAFYMVLALTAYLVFRVIADHTAYKFRFRNSLTRKLVSLPFIALLVGAGLAAAQLLPTVELMRLGSRQALSYGEIFRDLNVLPVENLITALSPNLFGNPVDKLYVASALPSMNYIELTLYVGTTPLLLAALALLSPHKGLKFFFAGLGLFSLLMALGTPIYYPFYLFVPGFRQAAPTRILILYALSISVLAGLGADYVLNGEHRQKAKYVTKIFLVVLATIVLATLCFWIVLTSQSTGVLRVDYYSPPSLPIYLPPVLGILGAILVLSWYRGWLRPLSFQIALLSVILIDLLYFGMRFNTTTSRALLYPETPALKILQGLGNKETYRVMLDSSRKTLYPNTLTPFGIQEVGGYDSLYPGYYTEFMNLIQPKDTDGQASNWIQLTNPASRLLDLLNVKYVIADPVAMLDSAKLKLIWEGEVKIYENTMAFPRAFLVPWAEVISDEEGILARLEDPSFAPGETVLLDKEPQALATAGAASAGDGEATITSYTPDHVTVRANPANHGFLVLSDTYYPGWKATVDGKPAPLYRANYVMRAVQLPAGQHQVEFTFDPPIFRLGLSVTLFTILASAVYLVASLGLGIRKKRRNREIEE